MGKSFELLGLASFNIFIALILSTTFLTNHGGGGISHLTESAVESFIMEVSDITGGKKPEMDSYAITSYFMEHVADDSVFTTTLQYDIPHTESEERTLQMNKIDYISNVLQSKNAMERYESMVKIDFVSVDASGREASAVTTNYERGMMPVEDGMGQMTLVPVDGTSYCEQKFVLSENKTIQMASATCTTDLKFSEGM